MRTVDIFANVMVRAISDRQARKYGAMLLMRRTAGLNPTVVWLDAAVAVLEATESYFRYCAACEVTEQLREYNRALEITLAQELRLGEVELRELREKKTNRLADIERTLKSIVGKAQISKREIRNQLGFLKKMHVLLQQQRVQSGEFQELIGLQVCLDSCIDATLALLLDNSGE